MNFVRHPPINARGVALIWEAGARVDGDAVFLELLGPFRLRDRDGRPTDLGGVRVRMLVARLALDVNRTVSTEALIADLWGDDQPRRAQNALQSLVSRARRALGELTECTLRSDNIGYALEADADSIDLHRFERLAARGRRFLDADRPSEAADDLREALALWRGDALVDFVDAHFAQVTATDLGARRLRAIEDRMDARLRLGEQADVVDELDTLTNRQPLRERTAELHIRALRAADRKADALAAYERVRQRLADELGTDPGKRLRELHSDLLRDDEPSSARTQRSERPGTRLPSRLSDFVGRETEIQQVAAALGQARLVTLFGPGGAGKTRLATESAARNDGPRVLFVELAPIRDSNDLASAVLSALGLRETPALDMHPAVTDAESRLAEAMAGEPTVLVLDNCEHLISAAAELVERLLAHAPRLRVLATSREPLALPGEKLLAIGPLGLPDSEVDAETSASVRLFVDRAGSVRHGFALDESNTGDVVEICRRLDGMPLAIELAAARLRAMSTRQIADRLDDRFRLLTRGYRTSMPRHRTLRAVVEWSWDLLEEQERVLARRMSVFAGSVRAESIADVCAGAGIAAEDTDELLAGLADKSLVEVTDAGTVMRYRMLETVRAYCAERLGSDEREAVRHAHARHFLDVVEGACPRLHQDDQLGWVARLDDEHDNIMGALQHSVAIGDAERAFRFVAALGWYWSMTARHSEVHGRLHEVAALDGQATPQASAVTALMSAFFADADDWSDQLAAAAARVRDTNALDRYHYVALLEPIAWMLADEPSEMERSIRRSSEHTEPWVNATALYTRAVSAEHRGEQDSGEYYARQAAEKFRKIGDRWGLSQAIGALAGSRSLRGDFASAVDALEDSIRVLRELGSTEDLVPQLARVGMEKTRAGDLAGARRDLEEAEQGARRAFLHHRVTVAFGLADLERAEGNPERAWQRLEYAYAQLDTALSVPQPLRRLLQSLEARLLIDRGQVEQARERMATAMGTGSRIGDMPMAALLARQVSRVLMLQGHPLRAVRMLGVSAVLHGALDIGDPDVRVMTGKLEAAVGSAEYQRAYAEAAALSRKDAYAELEDSLRSKTPRE